jgi:hypothetical protein
MWFDGTTYRWAEVKPIATPQAAQKRTFPNRRFVPYPDACTAAKNRTLLVKLIDKGTEAANWGGTGIAWASLNGSDWLLPSLAASSGFSCRA